MRQLAKKPKKGKKYARQKQKTISRKAISRKSKPARDLSEAIIDSVHESLVMLDPDLSVYTANKIFYQTFQLTAPEVERHSFPDIASHQFNIPMLLGKLNDVVHQDVSFTD